MITGVRCLLYTDDLVIWTESPKKQAAQLIHRGLNLALKVLKRCCDENSMKVNLNKKVSVTFCLTHLPLHIDLSYRGHVIPEADSFSYLGEIFDRKLSWRAHTENIVNRVSNRMTIFERLAVSKWSCSNHILNITYKLFILPILTYCCEPLITASRSVTEILKKGQNQALRIITGAVKTIDAMLLTKGKKTLKEHLSRKSPATGKNYYVYPTASPF
ncbi:reverse transcriptase domain-containing protein [Trichonephila inaurata madagascariensis]|uniref:Reverse transcriptase domain-containing protein n=1 Tax=Trichonephila inaurata madagascariensis TaxID=2747483 RepID=A0A8X6YBC1_9ARAC|nr:reverse transcriptase domain-containing protein [Trichonephila inaurata madagascariensis]